MKDTILPVIRYKPDSYDNNEEMRRYYESMSAAITKISDDELDAAQQMYLNTCTVRGLQRYEKILKITSSLFDSIDARKANIQNEISLKPPFTLVYVKHILDDMYGEHNVIMEEVSPLVYYIGVIGTDDRQSRENDKKVRNIIPANVRIIVMRKFVHFYLRHFYTYGEIRNHPYTYGELSMYGDPLKGQRKYCNHYLSTVAKYSYGDLNANFTYGELSQYADEED